MFRTDLADVEREIYWQGARDALTAFAIWKDGVQHTNDMRTLKDALATVKREIEYISPDVMDPDVLDNSPKPATKN